MTHMRHFVTVGSLAAALILAAGPVVAQTVIGGGSEPGVVVNLDALNALGPDTGATSDLYGTTTQQPATSTTGSVLLIAPPSEGAGTTLTPPSNTSGSVLLLDQPVTTPDVATNTFVFPAVPEPKPAVPAGASAGSDTQDDGLTTTTTVTTVITQPEPLPEPEPVVVMAMPEDEIMGPPQEVLAPVAVVPEAPEVVVPPEVIVAPEPEVVVAPEPEVVVAPEPEVVVPQAEVAVTSSDISSGGLADTSDDAFQQIDAMLNEPVEPESIIVPEPEMEMETTEVVSLPPSEVVSDDNLDLQILFDAGVDTMTDADQVILKQLADRLSGNPDQRIQLRAYASSDDGTASAARRLALARALQVRAYLIENSVRSTRIDVRALGDKVEGSGPLDRIDIVLIEP